MLYLVTGAASGLGRSLALELARGGERLVLVDLAEAALADTARACEAAGSEVHALVCDLTVPDALATQVVALPEAWRVPDVVIANAGLAGINPGYAFSRELDARILAVNYHGVVHTLMPFVEGMIARKSGMLVGISSLAALRGLPNASSYCASKAAMMTFLESVRVDLRGTGVRVCCVHPGFLRTQMTAHDEFPLPFLVSSEDAARKVLRGIRRGRSQVYFPFLLGWLSRFNRWLPNALSDWIARRIAGPANKQAQLFSGPPPG